MGLAMQANCRLCKCFLQWDAAASTQSLHYTQHYFLYEKIDSNMFLIHMFSQLATAHWIKTPWCEMKKPANMRSPNLYCRQLTDIKGKDLSTLNFRRQHTSKTNALLQTSSMQCAYNQQSHEQAVTDRREVRQKQAASTFSG